MAGLWELAGKVKTQLILLVSNSLNREGVIIVKYFLLLYFIFQSILNQKYFFLIFKLFFLFFPEIFKVAGKVSTLTNIFKYRGLSTKLNPIPQGEGLKCCLTFLKVLGSVRG